MGWIYWLSSPTLAIIAVGGLFLFSWRVYTWQKKNRQQPPPATEQAKVSMSEEIPSYITASDNDTIRRDQWVGRLVEHVFRDRHQRNYNVLVINNSLEYHFNSTEIAEDKVVQYMDPINGSIPFRVLVFNEGQVVNFGEGGYVNWHFIGGWTRHGVSSVTFHPRKRSGESK
ncbi:stress response protein yvgo [Colletotrichum truncatum]|uniref:Stress response protein yvgo n=1 Tax=Colletotrichum truncatum TaxID=5467 RepID=A0ACC3Z4U5_COLTU|nr:stress response protein yvgo [Colletotrichum truncatum]KAF6788684.1 stress response protein yvgo [Colletotrichum truncatum]